jgi:glutamate 5-kinase
MRVVIKVGTSTLAHNSGRLNIRRMAELCRVIADLKNAGNEIILVSSGAIGMGMGKLSLDEKPTDIPSKQACAAVGQCELMYVYDKQFSEFNHIIAQILLTAQDVEDTDRLRNFENTLFRLLELNVLPIINENDTVATAELGIGENDTLAAIVAVCAGADLLVMLSDIAGLYDKDPHQHHDARLIPVIHDVTPEICMLGSGSGSCLGTGGMATKLEAARYVTERGIDMVIANGAVPSLLYEILEGGGAGTRFIGKKGDCV